ncbi:hypothetical protein [uncultured Clostridium sp.]|uniref:hypothetical protein n=1 Tax=uncultured Clostridium sp. TaxID=59620 RepID=UPI0026ED90CD|nr:hypothetical protein [uncultured Clostridium sp.]
MAMNPMQRRARTSFIIGFLVALIIGALAVGGLLLKIRSINEAKEAIEALQKQVYVATEDLESGDEVTMDDFVKGIVQTSMTTDEMITPDYFEFEEDGEIITKLDDDGNQIQKTMVMKINVPKGTIITKDMMYESGKGLKDSERIQEFNMIRLPSQLKNGDFIDVRFSLPNGQDFVVLSKKKVIGTNATTVWLQLDELELNLMNNAIVESYKATGSRLYAIEYIEPGMQKDAVPTYVASSDVLNLINRNPNIISEAREKYGENINGLSDFRALNIESSLEATRDQSESLVSSGNANEDQSIKAERQTYVDALEGTDDIGYIE